MWLLDEVELEEIQAYFKIDSRIQRLKITIERLRIHFYDRTLTTRTENDGTNFYTVGERVENTVPRYLDCVLENERAINVLEKRKRYLNDFIQSLPADEANYLINRYRRRVPPSTFSELDYQLYDEITEINEAINFMYDFPQDQIVKMDNNNVEDNFTQMLELLGV